MFLRWCHVGHIDFRLGQSTCCTEIQKTRRVYNRLFFNTKRENTSPEAINHLNPIYVYNNLKQLYVT